MNAPLPDLALCAGEPIRVPGAIQPHGRMAVLAPDGGLVAWSANWSGPDEARRAAGLVADRLDAVRLGEGPAILGRIDFGAGTVEVLGHRSGDLLVLEFEAASADTGTEAPIYSLARHFLPQLQRAQSVQE
ncbi:MAG: histidine kinase, partial [Comamonadaceae bacterium]